MTKKSKGWAIGLGILSPLFSIYYAPLGGCLLVLFTFIVALVSPGAITLVVIANLVISPLVAVAGCNAYNAKIDEYERRHQETIGAIKESNKQ